MFKVGVKNFRQFQELEPLEIKPITFLVGRNNSGKSTLVKALILTNNYLNSNNLEKFSFVNNVLNDTNVVSFGRAKNKANVETNSIEFNYELNEFQVTVVVSGQENDSVVNVLDLIVKDNKRGFLFEFDNRMDMGGHVTVFLSSFSTTDKETQSNSSLLTDIEREIYNLKSKISKWTGSKYDKEFLTTVDELQNLQAKEQSISYKVSNSVDQFTRTEIDVPTDGCYLKDLTKLMEFEIESGYESIKGKSEEEILEDDVLSFYAGYKDAYDLRKRWAESFNIFTGNLNNWTFHFIGATSMKQHTLLSIKDTNNPLAVAVHDYFQNRVYKYAECHDFTLKWLKLFEIGDDFKIEIHEGEAYSVKIKSDGYWVSIADKGMGSIQAFIIILKLATIGSISHLKRTTVLIEEPELNLHPALQSNLAEMLHEAFEKFSLRILVETHSEYLIRNTQLLVKRYELEIKPNYNPFSVIYFDKGQKQWKMNYREDGKFIEDFGTGFYNESARLAIDLL